MTTVFIVIIFGSLLILWLFRHWYRMGYYSKEITRSKNKPVTTYSPKARTSENKPQIETKAEPQKKGEDFERFVVSLFDKSYYTILEWRSDKEHNGMYALANLNPDLEIIFKSKYHAVHFAIECKWRKEFVDNQIQWAKDYQLNNYKKFEWERQIPVFVIIGIGGKPSSPAEVYIVPLNKIGTIFLNTRQLAGFKRYNPSKNLFLHPEPMVLE